MAFLANKQSIEFRVVLTGSSDSTLERRKLELLTSIAAAVKLVQENTNKSDTYPATLKTSFASNVDLFNDLPNSLKDIYTEEPSKTNES